MYVVTSPDCICMHACAMYVNRNLVWERELKGKSMGHCAQQTAECLHISIDVVNVNLRAEWDHRRAVNYCCCQSIYTWDSKWLLFSRPTIFNAFYRNCLSGRCVQSTLFIVTPLIGTHFLKEHLLVGPTDVHYLLYMNQHFL
jgi:hypothetical protein